jgi:hypothetical protein
MGVAMRFVSVSWLAAAAFGLANFGSADLAVGQAAICVNSVQLEEGARCNIIMQCGVESEEGDIPVGMLCPNAPNEAVSVKYVWLDALQTSYLLGGYSDESVSALIGANPAVHVNSVLTALESIYDQFGAAATPDTFYEFVFPDALQATFIGTGEAAPKLPFRTEIPEEVLRNFRLPLFSQAMVWTAPADGKMLTQPGPEWPASFAYSYANDGLIEPDSDELLARIQELAKAASGGMSNEDIDFLGGAERVQSDLADAISACLSANRFVSEAEFDRYWDEIKTLLRDAAGIDIGLVAGDLPANDPDLLRSRVVTSETHAFLDFVTVHSWPADFLLVQGRLWNGRYPEACDGIPGMIGGSSFEAIPRSLETLVAVIEPTNAFVTLSGIELAEDSEVGLRTVVSHGPPEEIQTGRVRLSRDTGDSFVIPLQIGLSYDTKEWPFSAMTDQTFGRQLVRMGRSFPDLELSLQRCTLSGDPEGSAGDQCAPVSGKLFNQLPEPSTLQVTPRYTFGKALQVTGLTIDGAKIDVREVPEVPLYKRAWIEFGAGSCPFVYFELADGTTLYHGRVLVGANSPALARTDTIRVPPGTRRVLIRELEPEISYIDTIGILNFHSTEPGSARYVPVTTETLVIPPGTELAIDVPLGAQAVSISGYYEVLDVTRGS